MGPEIRHGRKFSSVIHVDFAAAAGRRTRLARTERHTPPDPITLSVPCSHVRPGLLAAPATVLNALTSGKGAMLAPGHDGASVATVMYDHARDPAYRDLHWILRRGAVERGREIRRLYLAAPMTIINAVLLCDDDLRERIDAGCVDLFSLYEDGRLMLSYAGDLHWSADFGQDHARIREGEHA